MRVLEKAQWSHGRRCLAYHQSTAKSCWLALPYGNCFLRAQEGNKYTETAANETVNARPFIAEVLRIVAFAVVSNDILYSCLIQSKTPKSSIRRDSVNGTKTKPPTMKYCGGSGASWRTKGRTADSCNFSFFLDGQGKNTGFFPFF